ncbi:MAG: hypothetical protein EA421_09655 [Gemmatimonadales bacterium]|nr:MAG: hypothetical protein EA421_09655 [Gemmatimonadales bacterium]
MAGALLVVAGCSDSPVASTPEPELEPAINLQRVLVTDAEQALARVLAASTGDLLGSMPLSGPGSYVYASASGRYGVVQQRTADRVQFVDGGIWTHDDHAHRNDPEMLAFDIADGLPTHGNVNGDWISTFFDGSGRATWVNERDFFEGSYRIAFEVATGGPHHSGSATVLVGNTPYFVVAPLNPAGGLPAAVDVYNLQGQVVASVPDCPVMHGNASARSTAVFGCNNGLVLVRSSGGSVAAEKVTPTGEMEGLGLRNAWSAPGASVILGQFAARPGEPTRRVLAVIDVAAGSLHPLQPLPSGVVDHFRTVEPVSNKIVLLGTDGTLYVYSGATRQLERTIASVVPALPASGATTHQVSVVEGMAAVASPSTGEVVLVNLDNGSTIRRINVGGQPSRLAILGAREQGMYEIEG